MGFLKRFCSGIYAVVATLLVVAACVAGWFVLTGTDSALIPVAGSSVPVAIPVPTGQTPQQTVQVGGTSIRATIADTPATREKGLSGRAGLANDEGMLFIFPRDGTYSFWMKDMRFSIDIIWISAGGRIVHIAPDVSPETYPEDFVSPTPARYVLEVPAGFAGVHGLDVGDIVGL